MKKIALINHGCAKNLVDSELMLGALAQNNYEITLNEHESDIVIVNTCSFIHDAEKESVQSILKLVEDGKKVIVTGCLPQKHKMELKEAIPEIVALLGTTDIDKIVDVIKEIDENSANFLYEVNDKPQYIYPEMIERQQITMGPSSYIKIADGCNFHCGYCIIPQLRGRYNSRKIEDIVEEARKMGEKGVSEIILIAQDTTSYGCDLYGKPSLDKLLYELNKIETIDWIRFLYAYPSMVTDELLEVVKSCDKVVKYIDIPLQHSHPEILESMKRPKEDPRILINKIREKIPNVSIRTTFIVGYPGETDKHFEHLYNFVKDMKFDKMGVFTYSKEKNTFAYDLTNQVPKKIMNYRKNKLMELQSQISKEINESLVGKTVKAMVDVIYTDKEATGHTYRDAPEIDGDIYINLNGCDILPGDVVDVKIVKADEYDLWGVIN